MHRPTVWKSILAALLILVCLGIGLAQDAPKPIRVDVGLVLVNVSLFNSRQQPIVGYHQEDLEITEDGVRQEITYFGRDDLPLNLALALDISGSIIPILPRIKDAADEALDALRPADAVALFAFARRVRKIVDYTTDHRQVIERISNLSAGGGTALVDALYLSALSLRQLPQNRRRVIVMISDNQGMPVNQYSERDAIQEAQEAGAVVYGIQVKGPQDLLRWTMPTGIFSRRVRNAMRQVGNIKTFADATGGTMLSAEKWNGVEGAFREFMHQMSSQYYIGFFSSNSKRDGTLRKIEVKLSRTGKSRLGNPRVQHRRAYIAPHSP